MAKRERHEYYSSEAYKEKKRQYFRENRDKVLESNAAWRQTFKGRLLSYKRAALQRDISWDLSEEEFKSFWQQPCYYCCSAIETVGLDRIDNTKGYNLDNCIPCCTVCNLMKKDYSQEFFLTHIRKIYANN